MLFPNPATVFARERSKNGLYPKYFFVNRAGAHMGPIWAPWAPYGPNGPHMGPMGPIWAQWGPIYKNIP